MLSRYQACRAIPALFLAFVACDGFIAVDGHVFARAEGDTVLPSQAFVDRNAPDTTGLMRLDGAVVSVFHVPADTALADSAQVWVDHDTTSSNGHFHTASVTAPSRFTALLRVRRAGYRPVDATFVHDTILHRAIVILTPEGTRR